MDFVLFGTIICLFGVFIVVCAVLCHPRAIIKNERDYRLWRLVRMLTIICLVIGACFAFISIFCEGKLSNIFCFVCMFIAIYFASRVFDTSV